MVDRLHGLAMRLFRRDRQEGITIKRGTSKGSGRFAISVRVIKHAALFHFTQQLPVKRHLCNS